MKKIILTLFLILPLFAQSYVGAMYSAGDGTRGGVIAGMFVFGDWASEIHYWKPQDNTIVYGLSFKHFNNERMKYVVFDITNKIPEYKNDPEVNYRRGFQFGVGQNLFKTAKFSFPLEAGIGSLYDETDKDWGTVFYANIGVLY